MFSTQMGNNNLHSWLKEIFGTNQLDPQISVYFVSSKTRRGIHQGEETMTISGNPGICQSKVTNFLDHTMDENLEVV